MSYLRKDDYVKERVRPNLLTNYLQQMTTYLRLRHPTRSETEIRGFVEETIRDKFKAPMVEALVHRREGESKIVNMRLDDYVREVVADNNMTPSGSCYKPASRHESNLRISINARVEDRNRFKKLYLGFEAQGLKREAQYYYQNQANAKIFNNAIAGGMGIKQFILGSKAGFNAITSVGRICVKQGYSFIERAVIGNIYLPSTNDAISYVINHIRHIPEGFPPLISQHLLYIPTTDEVVQYLLSSVQNYTHHLHADELTSLIVNLTDVERSYVFYAGCLNNLCRFNEVMMRNWVDSCFIHGDVDPSLYADIMVGDLKKYPEDVINAVLATNYQRLGRHPKKENRWNSLKDAKEFNPEGLKAFIHCCRHFVEHFTPHLSILKPIFQIETTFSQLTVQHKMARFCVPLSDTDSNIFSTQELIRWKSGKIDFSQMSYEMNAIVVLILSQSLEHVFGRLSAGLGTEGKDGFRISMKNEFLYPVAIITPLAKHYMAIATMQEGSLLPNPRKDIKGVNIRSSTYPKLIRDAFESYIVELFAEIQKGEPISAIGVLQYIATLEKTIYDSVQRRESEYLQTVTVRRKEDYADPEQSNYFHYEFWKAVFADEYGEMIIPNKCYKIPLKGGKKIFKDPVFLENLSRNHPKVYRNLMRFMENNPDRLSTSILVPPSKGPIGSLFLEMMDVRSHISQSMSGFYLLLESLGVGSTDGRVDGLVSDFCDPSTPVLE